MYAGVMANSNGATGPAIYPVYLSIQTPLRVFTTELTDPSAVDEMIADAKKGGHDGVIDEMGNFVVFQPTQIKSATGNNGDFDPDNPSIVKEPQPEYGARQPNTNPFYSQLASAIAQVPDRLSTQPGKQWALWLDSNAAKLGVKKEEIERTGVKDWLALQGSDKVGKGEIADYLRNNGVQVEEVMREKVAGGLPLFMPPPVYNPGGPTAPIPNNAQQPMAIQGGQNQAWQATEPGRLDRFIYEIQDRQIDLKRVQEAIKENNTILEQFDAYQKEELYHGRVAVRTEQFLEKELRPLLMDMRMKGITLEELENYLWARHAPERNAQIATINQNMPDGGSGLTNAQAADYMAGNDVLDANGDLIMRGLPQAKQRLLAALAVRTDAISAGTKQILVQYGLEDSNTIAAWDAKYQHYAPLFREDMDGSIAVGQGFSIKGSSSKRAMGSQRRVVDIIANLALQREAALTRGEKNRVSLALYGLAIANPNPDFWQVDRVPMIKTIDRSTGFVISVPDPNYKNKNNVLVLRVGGKDKAIIFNERDPRAQRMVQVMKNLDVQDFGEIIGGVAAVTRYMASINTQYNPVFGFVNGIRDVQAATLNITTTPLRHKKWAVLKKVPAAMRAIWKIERHGTSNSAWDQVYDQMRMSGGTTGYREVFRVGSDRAKALQKEINKLNASAPRKALNWILDWLDHYNTAIENATRLAAYKAGIDAGLSVDKAASVAKNLTVNFNRKGKLGREAGAFYAFFNASVQGTARMVETLRGPAGRKIILGGIAVGILQTLIAAMVFDDDEWEKAIPEFVKQKNFILPMGKDENGKHYYVSIPYPLGFNVLPNIGRIVSDMIMTKGKNPGDKLANLLMAFIDSTNPLGSSTPTQTLSPTITDPVVALAENKDFTGRQIAKQDASPLAPTPGFRRPKDKASTVSRLLAEGIDRATGGTGYTPGLISPTPDQIDYVFGVLTGGVGRELNKAYQFTESAVKGEDVPEYKKPIVGRFFGSTVEAITVQTMFWDNIKELNAHELEVKGRMKDDIDTTEYFKNNPDATMWRAANRVQGLVTKMLAQRRDVEFDKKLSEKKRTEQLKQIDADMQALMVQFNKDVKESKKSPETKNKEAAARSAP